MLSFLFFLIFFLALLFFLYQTATRVVLSERGGEVFPIRKLNLKPQLSLFIIILLGLLIIFITSIRVVPVGHAIVKFNILTKHFSVSGEGITFVPPFIYNTYIYDLRRQEYTMSAMKGEGRKKDIDDSLWSPTQEGLQVGIDLTCWYRIAFQEAINIHRKIGPDYDEKVVRPAIRSVVRHIISRYPIMEVYSAQRAQIQEEIKGEIKKLLEPDGFQIEEIVLRDVHFTPDFAKSIEDKQIAQQEAERMKYVLEKETKEAERKKIEAGGKAASIEIVSEKLKRNPEYTNYLYIDKLSDKVQVIISDQGTILDLKDVLKKEKE